MSTRTAEEIASCQPAAAPAPAAAPPSVAAPPPAAAPAQSAGGGGAVYDIPGMENMDPEQYRQALRRKLQNVRAPGRTCAYRGLL